MYYGYASTGIGGLKILPGEMRANVGADFTYFTTGETDVVNERGEFLGRYTTYDLTAGLHAGVNITSKLGVGANLKYIRSFLVPEWVWEVMPELGIDHGGTANDVAADIGVLYKPVRVASVGLTLANLGPNIRYSDSGESAPLPWTLRLGGCYTPLDRPVVRVRALLEMDKILVGIFTDTTGLKTAARMWKEELRDAWKSAAVEATFLQLLTARVGYFEDWTGQRGGIVMEKDEQTFHYSLYDVLTRKNLGRVRQVGLCWGVAAGYKDHLRMELSSDASIYDFPTENWKVALTVNDVGGMLNDLLSNHPLDWLP
jgi:hypothetical protein